MAEREYKRDEDGQFAASEGHAAHVAEQHGGTAHKTSSDSQHDTRTAQAPGATKEQIHETLVKRGFKPAVDGGYSHEDGTKAQVRKQPKHVSVDFRPGRDYVRKATTMDQALKTHEAAKSKGAGAELRKTSDPIRKGTDLGGKAKGSKAAELSKKGQKLDNELAKTKLWKEAAKEGVSPGDYLKKHGLTSKNFFSSDLAKKLAADHLKEIEDGKHDKPAQHGAGGTGTAWQQSRRPLL